MAAFRTGDTITWLLGPFVDINKSPVTGGVCAVIKAIQPGGTFSPTYSEISDGLYQATVVGNVRGLWALYSSVTANGVVYRDFDKYTVDDELAYPASGAAGSVGAALANLDTAVSTRAASGASVTVVGPISSGGDVSVLAGNAYLNADGRALTWTNAAFPSFTSATAVMTVKDRTGAVVLTKSVTLASATSIRVDLTATDTNLPSDSYRFAIVATLADGSPATLVAGGFSVTKAGT